MIVEKNKKQHLIREEIPDKMSEAPRSVDPEPPVRVEDNPMVNVYLAIKKILQKVTLDPNDKPNNPDAPKLFKTVKMDNGQFERIVRSRGNEEFAVAFPAAFIRFTNVRFLVQQQRIGEGRANLRIRYILNNLNSSDDEVELEGARRFQQINDDIQAAKNTEPALNERCNLLYWDMPECMQDGLQPYWIDYEIWFRISSSFQYKDWVERYLVMPPFTNHSDAPEHDTEGHGDHKVDIEDVSRFEPSVETWLPFEFPSVLKD